MGTPAASPASPSIAALARQLRAGRHGALGALEVFWRGVAAAGAPLIEPDEDGLSTGAALVTFLWRGDREGERVGVITQLAPRLCGTGAAPLRHLEGSDVWYATFHAPRDVRTTYWLSVAAGDSGVQQSRDAPETDAALAWIVDSRNWRRDPLNPCATADRPPGSLLALADAPAPRWSAPRPGTPAGTLAPHTIPSEILGNERSGWVYTPPGFDRAAGPYDLLLLLDGWAYATCVPTAAILDNLIGAGLLPPTVALLIGNPNAEARQRELGCHDPFVAFVADELVPWVRRDYAAAAEPERCVVGGSSRGGLAAAFVGLRRPDLFGGVLCQSGSFWFAPDGEVEPEWLARQFAAEPRKPLRFHLEVGLLEVGEEGGGVPTMLTVSRHLRDVLRARGYAVDYREFSGGHDYSCWEVTLPDALLALLALRATEGARRSRH